MRTQSLDGAGEAGAAQALTAWRGVPTGELSSGEIAKLAIERGLVDPWPP